MQPLETRYTRSTTSASRIRMFKRRQPRRELPPVDLRPPSGRRELPY
ncbi:MAG TPA: hypothetical protein VFU73_11405 [Actinocrinis sp.]|nr:hypothetical protein [Actinocrinis sp.]